MKSKLPTPEEAKNPPMPKAENLRATENEEIKYDLSQPVFQVTRTETGRVKIPTYEEIPKVTGFFKNVEHPGQPLSIPFRKGWKGPIRHFSLIEGQKVTIPITLCDHLNNECAYEEKQWVTPTGETITRPVQVAGGHFVAPNLQKQVKNRRSRFQFIVDHKVQYKPTIEKTA